MRPTTGKFNKEHITITTGVEDTTLQRMTHNRVSTLHNTQTTTRARIRRTTPKRAAKRQQQRTTQQRHVFRRSVIVVKGKHENTKHSTRTENSNKAQPQTQALQDTTRTSADRKNSTAQNATTMTVAQHYRRDNSKTTAKP